LGLLQFLRVVAAVVVAAEAVRCPHLVSQALQASAAVAAVAAAAGLDPHKEARVSLELPMGRLEIVFFHLVLEAMAAPQGLCRAH
jgi:hypothetical protein